MTNFRENLWDWQQEDPLILTPKLIDVIRVLEFVKIERFVPSSQGLVGRPAEYRSPIARAFVAKAVLDIPTTEALIDRLQSDLSLRRICGFQSVFEVPGAWTFSRAFAEFAELNLPDTAHNLLIGRELGNQIIGHLLHDATQIEAREKPIAQPKPEPKVKRRRGRPCKGEERPPQPETVLEKQQYQTLDEMLANIPKACDVGSKKNSGSSRVLVEPAHAGQRLEVNRLIHLQDRVASSPDWRAETRFQGQFHRNPRRTKIVKVIRKVGSVINCISAPRMGIFPSPPFSVQPRRMIAKWLYR